MKKTRKQPDRKNPKRNKTDDNVISTGSNKKFKLFHFRMGGVLFRLFGHAVRFFKIAIVKIFFI